MFGRKYSVYIKLACAWLKKNKKQKKDCTSMKEENDKSLPNKQQQQNKFL